MSLDTDDIKAIAKLARLNIDEADVPLYATNLSNILHLVEQMNSVDTNGVVPMSHPLDVYSVCVMTKSPRATSVMNFRTWHRQPGRVFTWCPRSLNKQRLRE